MKYKLINNKTKEEHLCDKVTIDGFDYYISDRIINEDELFIMGNELIYNSSLLTEEWCKSPQPKPIATTNPNIDIPKVVDEVEIKVDEILNKELPNFTPYHRRSFFLGYNKSQETHPFSEEDMKNFGKFCIENNVCKEENRYYQYWELLQLWKEQKPKTLYYV